MWGRSSRPGDKGEGGRSQKNLFRPFGPQFGLKIRGAPGLSPSPGSATMVKRVTTDFVWIIDLYPHLVQEHQCLGTSTKCCCVHTLITWLCNCVHYLLYFAWVVLSRLYVHLDAGRERAKRVCEGWSWWTKGRDSPFSVFPITPRAPLDHAPLVNIDIDCLQIPIFFVRSSGSSFYRYGRPSWFHVDLTLIQDGRQQNKAFDLDDLTEK